MLTCFLPAHSVVFMSEAEAICDVGNWDNATNKVGKRR